MALGPPTPKIDPPTPAAKKKAVYHTDIDKIKLPVFIDCLVTENLKGLVISGDPDPAELTAVWNNLHTEYLDRIGGMNLRATLSREKEIMQIVSRYDRIMMTIYIARHLTYCDEIAEIFAFEGYKFDSNADDEMRERQLKIIEAKLKPELLRLQRLTNAKDAVQSKSSRPSWKEFNDLLARMSHGEGFLLRANDLTVGEFCSYLSRYQERVREASKPTFKR